MYIMALTIMPCTDSITCENKTSTASTQQHDHREDDTDSCSPFCVCSCCGVAGVLFSSPTLFFERIKKADTPILASTYNSAFISTYFYTFWQPPKI
jgi:hypothetical protein